MKKTSLFSSIILCGALSFSGCKKFLEKEPDNRTNIVSAEQISQLLVTAYPHANYITFCEAMSDNVEDKGTGDASLINMQPFMFQDVQSTDLDSPNNYWYACYKAIAAANEALAAIDRLSGTGDFSAQKGEALVARAYAHFMLVTLFAKAYDPGTAATDPGVPYLTAPETEVFAQYDRKTVKYVYDMIEKDLTTGLPLINDKIYGTAPKFHFNVKAANAFACRFYLFKQDYAKVIAYASQAVQGNVSDNLRGWNTTYAALSAKPVEIRILYGAASERTNIMLQEANSLWGRSLPSYRYAIGNSIHAALNGTNITGAKYSVGNLIFGSDFTVYNIPKFYENFVYASPTANFGDPYNTIPLFCAEEVVFNRAEANARLKNYDAAIADLNGWIANNVVNYTTSRNVTAKKVFDYYKSATITDTTSAIVKNVLDFKKVAYIEEGLRWFDILRLKLPVTHTTSGGQVITLEADDKRKLLQLPTESKLAGLPLNPR